MKRAVLRAPREINTDLSQNGLAFRKTTGINSASNDLFDFGDIASDPVDGCGSSDSSKRLRVLVRLKP